MVVIIGRFLSSVSIRSPSVFLTWKLAWKQLLVVASMTFAPEVPLWLLAWSLFSLRPRDGVRIDASCVLLLGSLAALADGVVSLPPDSSFQGSGALLSLIFEFSCSGASKGVFAAKLKRKNWFVLQLLYHCLFLGHTSWTCPVERQPSHLRDSSSAGHSSMKWPDCAHLKQPDGRVWVSPV